MTDVNIKPTDARVYLHFSSFHPRHTFLSVVYSQCLRYKRLISNNITLIRRLGELKQCFLKSGYPEKLVDGVIDDVLTRRRSLSSSSKSKDPPNNVMWVQTFGPATGDYLNIVKQANKNLQLSQLWKGNNKVIGVVSRKAKSLGDMILQRKRSALHTCAEGPGQGTSPCTVYKPGDKRKVGRPCASCPLMSGSASIVSTTTGKCFKTPNANCKTRNLTYCATCQLQQCSKQYTGRTVTKLSSRISKHRGHLSDTVFDDESDEATLAEHLVVDHGLVAPSSEVFNSSYLFTVLERDPQDIVKSEQRWTDKLLTLRPFGLNKEKPGGVAASVSSMCSRALGRRTQR